VVYAKPRLLRRSGRLATSSGKRRENGKKS
jgi:hypothetical protein